MDQPNKSQSVLSFRRYSKPLEPLITKPQNRVYTATILSFLVVSLFLWYAIRPTIQTILSLRREIIDNTEVSKLMEEKISALVEAQAVYQEISADLPMLYEALPSKPEPMSALLTLRTLVSESGASISAINLPQVDLLNSESTSSGQKPDDIPNTLLTIHVDGSYTNLKTFLNQVMNLRRIMSIQSLFITTSVESENSSIDPTLRLILKLKLHHNPKGASS